MSTVVPEAPQTAPSRPNPFARILGVFIAPIRTISEIARRPDWVVALLVVTVLSVVFNLVAAPHLDFETEIRAQLEERGIPEEQIDKQLEMMSRIQRVSTPLTAILVPIFIFALAGILLIAFKMFGGEGGYVQALAVMTYANFPYMLKNGIATAIAATRGQVTPTEFAMLVKSNPGFLVDAKEARVAFAFLSSLDVFTFWVLLLLIVGFAELSKFTRARAAILVLALWGIIVLGKVAFAAL
jgi:hypothetical protein